MYLGAVQPGGRVYSILDRAPTLAERVMVMGIGKSLVDWTQVHLARFLATRPATPLILAGTLALAATGAVATTPSPAPQSPTAVVQTTPPPLFPAANCNAVWNGFTVCQIPANQVTLYIIAYGCYQPWHGEDRYVCPLMSN